MPRIGNIKLKKGIVYVAYKDGTIYPYKSTDIRAWGRDIPRSIQATKEQRGSLTRPNAFDYFNHLGIKVNDPQELSSRIFLTKKQAGELFLKLFVQQVDSVDFEDAQKIEDLPFTVREGLKIRIKDRYSHLQDILEQIWDANMRGESFENINILEIGRKYSSGIGTYILAEELLKAGEKLGISHNDLENMQKFYRLFKKVLGKKWTRQNLHFGSCHPTLSRFFSLTKRLMKVCQNEGVDSLLERYGSLRGMIGLAAEHEDMNLGHLFSIIGTRERLKELLDIPDNIDLSNWKWKQINLSARALNDLLTKLENLAKEKGWASVLNKYGSLRGMIGLAAEHKDMNLGQLFSAIGNQEKLKELLSIPDDINLSPWKWKIISLPARALNDLLTKLEKLAQEKGWVFVLSKYGSLRGMIGLATEHEDMSPGNLFSAIGTRERLKELLSIPDNIDLSSWKWKYINLPARALNDLLTKLEKLAQEKGWVFVLSKYGSLRGMIGLAAEHEDMHLGHLFSAIGPQERLKELLSIPDNVDLSNWKWKKISLPARALNNLLTKLEKLAQEKGWDSVLSKYGSLWGMIGLAAEHEDMHLGHLFSAIGTQERLKELLSIPDDINLSPWKWKIISLPARALNDLLTKLEKLAQEKGWDFVLNKYGSLRGMIGLAAEHEDMHLGHLFSAFGAPERLKELLSIPDNIDLSNWKWKIISLPARALNNLLTKLKNQAQEKNWEFVLNEYGSLRGMIGLAAEHEDMSPGNLFSAIGAPERLKELLSIPDNVDLSPWKWKSINLPAKALNDLLTKLENLAQEKNWEFVLNKYGSLWGMIGLAAEHEDMNLSQLFSAIGTQERLKELLSIPDDINLSPWKWKYINLPARALNDLLTYLEKLAKEKGWGFVLNKYGSLRGMIGLAAEHEDMNLSQLFSAIGTRERLKELLSIPDNIDLSSWKWKQINLPARALNDLLTYLEKLAKEKGWDSVLSKYGSLRGMIGLAAEHEDMNLRQLFTALGPQERLKELLSIPDNIDLSNWKWKNISLPARALNNLLTKLKNQAQEKNWEFVLNEYGSLRGMIGLAAEHEDMNLGHLFSAIGTQERLKELLNIPDDIDLSSWKWKQISLPARALNDLLTKLEKIAKEKGWDSVLSKYGSLRGMIGLAAEHEDMNFSHLFSAIGTQERLKELLSIPDDVNLSPWKWKIISLPAGALNDLLTKLKNLAKEKGWDFITQKYSTKEEIEGLAKECEISLTQLMTAIGTKEKLRELLQIPKDVDLKGWSLWKYA